jgi:putative membrane protein
MNLILKWLISALALLLASAVLAGIEVSSLYIALIVALILGFLNALVRPILLVLTLPINILTLGLFTFVLNGLIFWFVASFIEGFFVDGFFWAIIGALFVSVFSWAAGQILGKQEEMNRSQGPRQSRDGSYYHVDKVEKPDDK